MVFKKNARFSSFLPDFLLHSKRNIWFIMTSTTLKATHSDNFVTYTRADTTLVLCAKSFALTQANANVKTRRLIIYADAVIIGNQIESRGKEIHVHCNSLQFERSEGGSINLQGIDGINTAAKAPQDIKGQKGGSLLIHVHNLPIRPLNSNSSPWPTQLKINVAGGAAGRCHAEKSEDWVNGSAGSPGMVHSVIHGVVPPRLIDMCRSSQFALRK